MDIGGREKFYIMHHKYAKSLGAVMIWESFPWKQELVRDADMLSRWAKSTHQPSRRQFIMEKKIFLSSYVVRKLFEANKLTNSLREYRINCTTHKSLSSNLTIWNWHDLDRHYALDDSSPKHANVIWLINQIIHSYVFMISVDDDNHVIGFLVSSDHEKSKSVIHVNLSEFCNFVRTVGNDHITKSISWFDPETGKWVLTNS